MPDYCNNIKTAPRFPATPWFHRLRSCVIVFGWLHPAFLWIYARLPKLIARSVLLQLSLTRLYLLEKRVEFWQTTYPIVSRPAIVGTSGTYYFT